MAQVLYRFSVPYFMTDELACPRRREPEPCGLPDGKLRELAAQARFRTVTRVAENPFNLLSALKA